MVVLATLFVATINTVLLAVAHLGIGNAEIVIASKFVSSAVGRWCHFRWVFRGRSNCATSLLIAFI